MEFSHLRSSCLSNLKGKIIVIPPERLSHPGMYNTSASFFSRPALGVAINPPSGQGIQLSLSQPGQAITNFTSNAHSVFFTLVQSIQ